MKNSYLRPLGVYGFDEIEPLILASLISEEPILLIGLSGTGKTYLLNSISEALQLNHKHYNASLISFDDLIGFPCPNEAQSEVRFLPTPATIWDAESVLVDELSRCKPEIQNKFFSIVHERKIQGIALSNLRFRWAAMNPLSSINGANDESYTGSQALDSALADRFAFIIDVPDWTALSESDQEAVVWPAGEGVLSDDGGKLKSFIAKGRELFLRYIHQPDETVIVYSRLVTSFLHQAGIRISPRRARLLARSLVAIQIVYDLLEIEITDKIRNELYKLVLFRSIPQRAYSETLSEHHIEAAHAEAIRIVNKKNPNDAWLSSFLLDHSLVSKARKFLLGKASRDVKSLALIQFFQKETAERKIIFAFVLFPLIMEYDLVQEDALHAIGTIAREMMVVDGTLDWYQRINNPNQNHPAWTKCQQFIDQLRDDLPRQQRAKQLFLYLIKENCPLHDPFDHERELNELFTAVLSIAETVYQVKGQSMENIPRVLSALTPSQEAEISKYNIVFQPFIREGVQRGETIEEVYNRLKDFESFM
ncbi:MAG: AAA family ATPase [Chitinophagaceae bacterium]